MQLFLPANAQPVESKTHDDTEHDVLGQKRHDGKGRGGPEQRTPHRGEDVVAAGLEYAGDAVCRPNAEERGGD